MNDKVKYSQIPARGYVPEFEFNTIDKVVHRFSSGRNL